MPKIGKKEDKRKKTLRNKSEESIAAQRRTLRSQNGKTFEKVRGSGEKSKKQLSCRLCGENFSSKTSFKRHATSHENNNGVLSGKREMKKSRGRPRKANDKSDPKENGKRIRCGSKSPDPGAEDFEGSADNGEGLSGEKVSTVAVAPTPTTCPTCRHTYRSIVSYENHLASCIPYSSTSSSDESEEEDEIVEDIGDKAKRRPEYEEDVVISEDEGLTSDYAGHQHEVSDKHWNDGRDCTPGEPVPPTRDDSVQTFNSFKTNITETTQVPNASPSKTFEHAFSIRSIVANCDSSLNEENSVKPCNPLVASVERFFSSPTSEASSDDSHKMITPTKVPGARPQLAGKKRIRKEISKSQSVSTQVFLESNKSSNFVLPVVNNTLKTSSASQCINSTVTCSFKIPDKVAVISSPVRNHPENVITLDKHRSQNTEPAFVKPIPINVSPKVPKTSSSFTNPHFVQPQDPSSSSSYSTFATSHTNGMPNHNHYTASLQQSQFTSPYLNYSNTPTETITMQDSRGQVMRVQMPTVPSLVSQHQQTQPYGHSSAFNQLSTFGWQQNLQQQQQLNTYQQDVQNYQFQQQLQLQIQQQQFQPLMQHLPLINSNQVVNLQQGYLQQQFVNNISQPQSIIPWLSTDNSSQHSFQVNPSVPSNYGVTQQDVIRNDTFVLVQQNRAFPSAVSVPPQIPIQTQYMPSMDSAYKQNQFSQVALAPSGLQQPNGLHLGTAITSAPKVPEQNHKAHIPRGSAVAQPCNCGICLSKKTNSGTCCDIKSIIKNKIQQQFQNPTWSAALSLSTKTRKINPDLKQEGSRFKKILPAPQHQSSVEGLAAALASSSLVKNYDKSETNVIPSIAVVRPLENPLQKLSDQISQLGKQLQINTDVLPAYVRPATDSSHISNNLLVASVREVSKVNVTESEKHSAQNNLKVSVVRKRQGLNPSESHCKSAKRKYTKRQLKEQEVDDNEKSIRVTLKRNEGDSLYTIRNVRQKGCENGGSMKSLKIKAKLANEDSKNGQGATADVVVIPNVHVIPIPSKEGGHRVVKEDEVEDCNSEAKSGSASLTIEDCITGHVDTIDGSEMMTHRVVILYEVKCRDKVLFRSSDVRTVWGHVFELVHGTRVNDCVAPPLAYPSTEVSVKGKEIKSIDQDTPGLIHRAIEFLLKELPNKNNKAKKPKSKKRHVTEFSLTDSPSAATISGCARTEGFQERKRFDMFGWLASKHRTLPCIESVEGGKSEVPISLAHMRYKQLREKPPRLLNVFYSTIHGRGLFTRSDIPKGEMVIEYAGEVIRSILCDYREKLYESKGYGCYMFKIDEYEVVDATMRGNAARFINHSCDPNCKSKVVEIMGKSRILIFALRKILGGEELTYDYNFAKEHKDKKIPCTCGAPRCRKFLN